MAACHPPPPWNSAGLTYAPRKAVSVSFSKNFSTRTFTRARVCGWQKLLLRPDIGSFIALSKLRCLITLVSFTLLVTDIPRTGMGVKDLQEYYPTSLMPSTAVRFGPFNYPVVHISRLGSRSDGSTKGKSFEFAGLSGTKPIVAARVWSYQYDTTSVGLRGAVKLLNMTGFPDFIFYQGHDKNPDRLIALDTAFTMLDKFITNARTELHPQERFASNTLRYATRHNWVDRIHHYVVSFISKKRQWRLHSLHVTNVSRRAPQLSICSIGKRPSPRPRFCNHPGIWKCTNPLNASLPTVRLWDHMDLRLQSLSQRYPGLELDVTVISTQRLSSTSGALRSTFYNYEALEIVVLTRGRRCVSGNNSATSPSNSVTCSTVFVDDYRYERDIVETNLVDWYGVVAMLRGGAQTYVWVRLLLLGYGAYEAAGPAIAGALSLRSRVLSAVLVVLKIPFHVIVYSSLLPVVSYVIALFLDSSFMDLFLDSYWASVAGAINFELVPFLRTTAVQMRNVWLLALLACAVVFIVRKTRAQSEGTPGVRGLFISFTSTLTVCGSYKNTQLRDTNILSVFRVPNECQSVNIVDSNPGGYFNASSYIFDDSATMLLFCVGVVVGFALIVTVLGYCAFQINVTNSAIDGIILTSTPVAPCGIRSLWPTSMLSMRFYVHTQIPPSSCGRGAFNVGASKVLHENNCQVMLTPTADKRQLCSGLLSQRKVWPLHPDQENQAIDPFSQRSLPSGIHCRTTGYGSVLFLMNIAMMTDPMNLIWLRILGVQVYLYRIHRTQSVLSSSFESSFVVILPYPEDEMEEHVGLSPGDYQLLDSANSRDAPMSVLLQCG